MEDKGSGTCIHRLCMCEIIARMYETGSVYGSVNGLSHMARSSVETVYLLIACMGNCAEICNI